jgi:hypothetical protein
MRGSRQLQTIHPLPLSHDPRCIPADSVDRPVLAGTHCFAAVPSCTSVQIPASRHLRGRKVTSLARCIRSTALTGATVAQLQGTFVRLKAAFLISHQKHSSQLDQELSVSSGWPLQEILSAPALQEPRYGTSILAAWLESASGKASKWAAEDHGVLQQIHRQQVH